MNVLLIENTTLLASTAPSNFYESSVVCFQDSCYLILKKVSSTFRVDSDPTVGYGFGSDSVEEGLKKLIATYQDEDKLKARLLELIDNNLTCVINFADFKKVRIKGFLGTKTFSARQNALKYISFSVGKKESKALVEFYPNF